MTMALVSAEQHEGADTPSCGAAADRAAVASTLPAGWVKRQDD